MIRRTLFALLLGGLCAPTRAQPTPGSWSSGNNFANESSLNGSTITAEAGGPNRILLVTVQMENGAGYVASTFTIGGVAATGSDTHVNSAGGEALVNGAWCWNEAAIDAMASGTVAYDDNRTDDLVVSWVTLHDADQADAACTFVDEDVISAANTHALITTSEPTDYVVALANREVSEATGQYDSWDTLGELWDENGVSGSQVAGAAGVGGDDTTTVQLEGAETDDGIAASLVFSEAAASTAPIRRRRL